MECQHQFEISKLNLWVVIDGSSNSTTKQQQWRKKLPQSRHYKYLLLALDLDH